MIRTKNTNRIHSSAQKRKNETEYEEEENRRNEAQLTKRIKKANTKSPSIDIHNIVAKWCFHLVLGTVSKEKNVIKNLLFGARELLLTLFLFTFFSLSNNEYIEHIISVYVYFVPSSTLASCSR